MELHPSLLTRLRAFAAVGKHLSFKRAAEELHVTQSALSHHVRFLEQELATPLLVRLHRRIELTPRGAQLLDDCTRGFDTITVAVRRLKQTDETRPLVISVAPYFSARWLTPRLSSLWSQHPKLELQLRHAYEPVDFRHGSVDAGISWGTGDWPESEASRVLTGALTVICSTSLLKKLPRRPAPQDLLGQRLLYEFDARHWLQWFANAGVKVTRQLRTLQIDDSHALRRSVLDGHGVGLFFRGLLEEDVQSGHLQAPFAVDVDPGSAYYFVTPRGRPSPRNLTLFERWLMREALMGSAG